MRKRAKVPAAKPATVADATEQPAAPPRYDANPDWLPPATEGVEFTRDTWHGLMRLTCARCGWEKVNDAAQFDRHLREYHRLTLPEGA